MFTFLFNIENEADRAFVENLYIKYGKKIYLVAFGVLGKREDAEDCLQDVMRIIIDNLGLFADIKEENLIRLIVKCTRNTAIDKYRAEKRKNGKEFSLDEPLENGEIPELPDGSDSIEEMLINKETRRRLKDIISEIAPIYRDILFFRYELSFKYSEIARLLGVSENVVKTRLYRAKQILLKTKKEELYELRRR
jgi:RNA polymerase sigma-70 factor (ECF subfamily)